VAEAGVIEHYISALDRRLRGPAHLKVDLITEARDSLVDAAESYRDGGLPETTAQRLAVEDFGPIGAVARDYQGLLAVAHGARTLRTLLLVIPLSHTMWELNRKFWVGAWGNFGAPPPDWYIMIAHANDTTAWVVAAVALLSLLVGRQLARRGTSNVTMARLAGAVSVGAVGTTVFGIVAVMVATAHFDVHRLFMSPPVVAATVVSFLISVRLAVLARRCLVFSAV
jgi:hypothetical protein